MSTVSGDPAVNAAAVDLTDLPSTALHTIFSLLSGEDWARASCTCTAFRTALSDETAWLQKCTTEFAFPPAAPPATLAGAPLPTYRAAYADHAAAARLYPTHFPRACAAWRKIKTHLADSFPALLPTLGPGVTEAELDAAEVTLGTPLPPDLRAMYRIHDGQHLPFDVTFDTAQGVISQLDVAEPSLVWGLFGGYLVYNRLTSTRLLPLSRIVHHTRRLRRPPAHSVLGPTHVVVAASFLVNDKLFAVDTSTGTLFCNHPSNPAHPLPLPLPTPTPTPTTTPAATPPAPAPGALTWFESYADRLAANTYQQEVCPVNNARYLSLFSVKPPEMAEAVTRGVRIRASALYIPGDAARSRMEFFYSIRMALLSEEEQERQWELAPAGAEAGGSLGGGVGLGGAGGRRVLQSVQLSSRHWKIKEGDKPLQEISGDGVIGEYPLLEAGGPEFVYQSRTVQHGARGYMEGHFMFVEGSLRNAAGPDFAVVCPRFELFRPDFLF